MKNILESPEVFEAYAKIDLLYYGLAELQKELNIKRSPIVEAIDNASGYTAAKLKDNKDVVIDIIKQIIENKKIIEADYSGDGKILNEVNNLK